jgi:hypothetical protein
MILHRYSTALGEVQAAVAQVRRWVDAGIRPAEIAIVAPQIEDYWPSLAEYCETEGLPTNKARVTVASTHLEIQKLQARLKALNGSAEPAVLESERYSNFTGESELSYWEFYKHHANDYRDQGAKDVSSINVDAFLRLVLNQTRNATIPWLSPIIEKIVDESPQDLTLPFSAWLDYFERLCARQEILLRAANEDGIQILNLASVDWVDAQYFWCLGWTEENLKRFESAGLSTGEVMTLSAQLGFNLSMPDQRQKEFDALWFLQRPTREMHLSTASTDFGGTVQAASLLWLKAAFEEKFPHEALEIPPATRLREMQLNASAEADVVEFAPTDRVSLSPTTLEAYLECPFKVAAKKIFHLRDEPALDLDMDPMARGVFQHALFESLATEPFRADRSDDEILAIIDALKSKAAFGEAALWPVVRRRYLKMGRDFLNFEKDWREQWPQTATLHRELAVSAIWSLDQQRFVMQGSGLPFRGRMDRVDGDGEQIVLIDYKGSRGTLHHWQRWIDSDELQLAVYLLAIEDGVTALKDQFIAGAFYYVLKSRDRTRGLRRSTARPHLFGTDDGLKNWSTDAEYEQLLADTRATVQKVAQAISAGRFAPHPKELKICSQCHWKGLCRATHLS